MKKRMANLELLRCIAMMMVVVLHYLGKGNILSDLTGAHMEAVEVTAWLLESFCIVAVNTYMLISGYFLCTAPFKFSRLIRLYLQLWFYSAAVSVLGIAVGAYPLEEVEIHDLLTFLFPASMGHYWFITAYLFMYLFLPFISRAVADMTKQQMQAALGGLVFVFCVLKSILPLRLEMDGQGYDCIWYLCVFLTAAYIRKFGSSLIAGRRRSVCLYGLLCLVIFAVTMGLHFCYVRTGSLGRIMKLCLEYNHILPYLAAIGLFGTFLNLRVPEKMEKAVCRIAPHTLGVYLLHENLTLRYAWQSWLGADRISTIGGLLGGTLAAVIVVFTLGILADMLWSALRRGIGALLGRLTFYSKLSAKLEAADRIFAEAAK